MAVFHRSGVIINTIDFDHELAANYSLVVRAFNIKEGEEFISGTHSSITVNVTIVDVDEFGTSSFGPQKPFLFQLELDVRGHRQTIGAGC